MTKDKYTHTIKNEKEVLSQISWGIPIVDGAQDEVSWSEGGEEGRFVTLHSSHMKSASSLDPGVVSVISCLWLKSQYGP